MSATEATRAAAPARPDPAGIRPCPGCATPAPAVFYEQRAAPVQSVLLVPAREAALGFARGDIELAFCRACGFVFNAAVDPALQEYSGRYEETQGFSPTFNAFAHRLAEHLIGRYGLRGKTVLEIGCGKGEFLALLCRLGDNRGIGFDPAYVEARNPAPGDPRVVFVRDLYSERHAGLPADLVCCRMTLEHVAQAGEFVRMVRRTIGDRLDTAVFFQVPNLTRILRDVAFWDVYYEHCSYFSPGALARLFRRGGFAVADLWTDYGDQYLMLEARPAAAGAGGPLALEEDPGALARDVARFEREWPAAVSRWRRRLWRARKAGRRPVVWGAGSKAVAFLTALEAGTDLIEYAVDVNPFKHGTFLPGTGQEIVAPGFLETYRPEVVLVMNPMYRDEIRRALEPMGLAPDLLAVQGP